MKVAIPPLHWGVVCDKGPVRSLNEDRWRVGPLNEGAWLFAVADGMGGNSGGDLAAELSLEFFYRHLSERRGYSAEEVAAALGEALEDWRAVGRRDPIAEMSGASLAWVIVDPRGSSVGWLGDARVGRLSWGAFSWLTKDHSLVEKMLEHGKITPAEAKTHPHRNIVLRSFYGKMEGPPELDQRPLSCEPGDRLLICTDGIHHALEDAEIRSLLAEGGPAEAAAALARGALATENRDNLTALVVQLH